MVTHTTYNVNGMPEAINGNETDITDTECDKVPMEARQETRQVQTINITIVTWRRGKKLNITQSVKNNVKN